MENLEQSKLPESLATQQNADDTIAVNPNPVANNNITTQFNEMSYAEKREASESLNSEITDGEGK